MRTFVRNAIIDPSGNADTKEGYTEGAVKRG
jgi:hypothetical protein